MKFGDIFAHQVSGIAMGMSPAPTIAKTTYPGLSASHYDKEGFAA